MAFSYHPFGPCVPSVGTGTAGAIEQLGVSENGGNVTLEVYDGNIMSDAAGPRSPVEVQTFLMLATVELSLTTWDTAVINKLIAAAEASAAAGVAGIAGTLLGTGGFMKQLYLPSTIGEPWVFPNAKLEPIRKKEGTVYDPIHLRFKCLRWLPGSAVTAAGVALFTRVAPP